jgi:hypothetical protein
MEESDDVGPIEVFKRGFPGRYRCWTWGREARAVASVKDAGKQPSVED